MKLVMSDQPEGIYIIETLSPEEYDKRHKIFLNNNKIGTEPEYKIRARNLKHCNKRILVHRKPILRGKLANYMVHPSPDKPSLVPNIVIRKIYTEQEAQDKFPEYFL